MFNNRDELLGKLKSAPNPKELKEQFLEELQEGKEGILDFREELGQVLKERSIIPDIQDEDFYTPQMKKAQDVADHLEKITSDFSKIGSKFSDNSKRLLKTASVLGAFK